MSKQDRQGVRTPAALERKYRFGREIKQTNANVAKQEKQVQQNSIEMHVFMGATNAAISDIRRRLTDVEEIYSGIDEALAVLAEFAASTEVELLEHSEALQFLEAAIAGVQEDITGILADVDSISSAMEELQASVEEHDAIIDEHSDAIANLIERVSALEESEPEEPVDPVDPTEPVEP